MTVLVASVGCATEPITFTGPYYVRFTEVSAFARESVTDIIEIPVHLASPTSNRDLTVSYTVEGSAREGVDYVFVTEKGYVTIPEGEYSGTIKIRLINNANNVLRNQNIILTLKGVDDSRLLVGQGPTAIGNKFTFTIFDDCLLSGRYLGMSEGRILERDIMVTSDDCETYILSNWDIGFDNSLFDYQLTFIDVGDNSIIIPPQESNDLPEEKATIQGYGTVDLATKRVTLTVELVDYEIETTFTLIPD